MSDIINIKSVMPQEFDHQESRKATLGMVLGLIWAVMGSINESYEIAGKANRTFISEGFNFIKEAAASMKGSDQTRAWGQIGGGALALAIGGASLGLSKKIATRELANAGPINDRIARMHELHGAQLGNQHAVAQNIGRNAQQPANLQNGQQGIEMTGMQRGWRVRGQPHPEAQQPPQQPRHVPNDAEMNREAQALDQEVNQLRLQNQADLRMLNDMHNLSVPVMTSIPGVVGGGVEIPASLQKETSQIEQGTSRVLESEQSLSQSFYTNLQQTFTSLAITDMIMQAAIVASQIR